MAKLSPKSKRFISQILPFGLFWFCFALIYALLEKGLLGDLSHYPSTGNPYDFKGNLIVILVSSSSIGLLVGIFEISYLRKQFLDYSFSKKLLYKTIIYVSILIGFILLNTIVSNAIRLDAGLLHPTVWSNTWVFFTNFAFLSVCPYIAVIILISLFFNEVNDNVGHEILTNFFTGKYHHPIEEERIFMFLDMKSSTTIAEQMGHVKYFEMLKTYYADLSEPILQFAGEVYQYVGDEIIISWNLADQVQECNCLECFYAMKEILQRQSKKYQQAYGLVPEFKAGIHLGKVTTGEIGVIKKHIMFTGDVLNTTARIQGLCNRFDVDVLISKDLREKLNPSAKYVYTSLGAVTLRGRDEQVEIFSLQPKNDEVV